MTVQERQPPQNPPSVPPPSDQPAPRPWRTEGVPSGQPPKPRPRWTRWALWPVGYLMLFAMFTYQDRLSGAGGRVVHRVQGPGREQERQGGVCPRRHDPGRAQESRAVARPAGSHLRQVHTERPTFATDDLLAELTAGGATVRAKPLVQERGVSDESAVLDRAAVVAVRVLLLDVPAPAACDGRRNPRRPARKAGRSRNRTRHVRRRRRHRRGRGRDQRGRRLPARTRRSTGGSARARRKACC